MTELLQSAASEGHEGYVKLLLEKKADVDASNVVCLVVNLRVSTCISGYLASHRCVILSCSKDEFMDVDCDRGHSFCSGGVLSGRGRSPRWRGIVRPWRRFFYRGFEKNCAFGQSEEAEVWFFHLLLGNVSDKL